MRMLSGWTVEGGHEFLIGLWSSWNMAFWLYCQVHGIIHESSLFNAYFVQTGVYWVVGFVLLNSHDLEVPSPHEH